MPVNKYSGIFLIFFIIGGLFIHCTIHAMNEEDEQESNQVADSELKQGLENDEDLYDIRDYKESEEDTDDKPQTLADKNRLDTIKSALAAGRYGSVQENVRKELEIEKTIWFGIWLRKHAFIKGELVLLYEVARYFFKHEPANATSCKAGLKALLILLIRTAQDKAVMDNLFDGRTTYDLVAETRGKVKEWWDCSNIRGVPFDCEYLTILESVDQWFANRVFNKYANPASAGCWDFTYTRYGAEALKRLSIASIHLSLPGSQQGFVFSDVPANTFYGCESEDKRSRIASFRQTVAEDVLTQFKKYKSWEEFFVAL